MSQSPKDIFQSKYKGLAILLLFSIGTIILSFRSRTSNRPNVGDGNVVVLDQTASLGERNTVKSSKVKYRPCPERKKWFQFGAPRTKQCFDFNLLLLKGKKTGSSTTGGVVRRIAARYGLGCVACGSGEYIWRQEPGVIAAHVGNEMIQLHDHKRRQETYVVGMMRHPISRCLSQFYHFMVTRYHLKDTASQLIKYGNHSCNSNLLKYYSLELYYDEIDFLGTTERYTESLVLLGYDLGVTMGDLLYTKAKDSSQHIVDVSAPKSKKSAVLARHKPIDEQPEEVQQFFKGAFLELNRLEIEYYDRVVSSMDAKIERIGRSKFNRKVEKFNFHLKALSRECKAYGDDGNMLPNVECYWRDNGCNYGCFDQYATKHNLWDEAFE